MAAPVSSPFSPTRAQTAPRVPLRVVFLTNFIPPYWKPVLDLLSARYTHLRVLVSTDMEKNRNWKIDWEGLDVVRQKTITIQLTKHHTGFRDTALVHFPLDTLLRLWSFRPDVILSAEMGFRSLLAALYRKLRPKSRLIIYADISEHTERRRGWIRMSLRRILKKNADAFIVTGESGSRYMRSLGAPDTKMFKVPYASDVHHFDEGTHRDDEWAWRLLYVGRLIERKGLLPFIQCLSNWATVHEDRTVELALAGDGPLRAQLGALALPSNLQLTLLGEIDYDLIPRIYARAGIFAFPTLADTWGLVVNEALAAGLPVLGSVFSQAVEELVRDGYNGWVFRPDDSEQMYRAIDRAMSTSRESLKEMREFARSTALDWTPGHAADRIDAAVRAVATVK